MPTRFWRPYRRRGIVFDLSSRQDELALLEKAIESPDFWNDPDSAQNHMKKLTAARAKTEPWLELRERLEDLTVLAELAVEEDDESVGAEVQAGNAPLGSLNCRRCCRASTMTPTRS